MIALNIPLSMQVSNSMLESLDNVLESPAIKALPSAGLSISRAFPCAWAMFAGGFEHLKLCDAGAFRLKFYL
jgi:hypothetical protein